MYEKHLAMRELWANWDNQGVMAPSLSQLAHNSLIAKCFPYIVTLSVVLNIAARWTLNNI
jgi:hypothetical protein